MKAARIFLLFLPLLLFVGAAKPPKMQTVSLVDGVTCLLPKDFVPMGEDDIAEKYPSTKKPVAMYTNIDRTVDFGLNISKSRWSGVDIAILHDVYKATILESFTKVEFLQDTVKQINGRPFACFEFRGEFDGTTSYHYYMFSVLAQTKVEATEESTDLVPGNAYHVLIFDIAAPINLEANTRLWANATMESIRINANKASKSIPAVEQPKVKGLSPKTTLEQQNKDRQNKKK